MDFGADKTPIEEIKEEEHILERFILVLLESGTKSNGKKLFG